MSVTPQNRDSNTEPGQISGVNTKNDDINSFALSKDVGYGVGLLPDPPDEDVRKLQQFMQDNTGADVLPDYGIDGRWGPETQAAYDAFLQNNGVEGNKQFGNNLADKETIDKVKDNLVDDEEGDGLSVSEFIKRRRFQDQCFLMSNIKALVSDAKRNEIDPYNNIHLVNTKDPATLINKFRSIRGARNFLEIRHWELSQLTPTIRIYKQYYETGTIEPREVEFKFNSFVDPIEDLQNMLNSRLQRGVGIGIKQFSWDLQGVQPETAKKDIRAKLVIHAQNFNELFSSRSAVDQHGITLDGGYRIIDLVIQQARYRYITEEDGDLGKQKYRKENPNFHEIKVVVGWAATGGGGIISPDLSNALKDTQLTMLLNIVDHDLNFSDDGSVDLTIEYRARVESVMLDIRSDVLADEATRRERKQRQQFVRSIETEQAELGKEKKACNDEELRKFREAYKAGVMAERQRAYENNLKVMTEDGKITIARINNQDIEDSTTESGTPAETGGKLTFETVQSICEEDGGSEIFSNENALMGEGVRNIPYFFLGDLISVAFNNVMSRQEFEGDSIRYGKIKLVLGNIEFTDPDPNSSEIISVNIADIPISVELYNHFMHDKVVSKGLGSYPLLIFIRDVMKSLVIESLNKHCYGDTVRPSIILDTAQISADSLAGGADPIAVALNEQSGTESKVADGQQTTKKDIRLDIDSFIPENDKFLFNSFNRKPMAEKYSYFVVYAYNKTPGALEFDPDNSRYDARYDRDLSRGIYHLTTGLDRGLVKKMSFSKTTIPGLREARLEASDFDPELQLTNVYNVDVQLYGNNLFFPGAQVYINPRGLGADLLGDPSVKGSNANIMGLGGYFVVGKVSCTIDRNGFSTNIDALFTTSGDGLDSTFDDNDVVGDQPLIKCNSLQQATEVLNSSFRNSGVNV